MTPNSTCISNDYNECGKLDRHCVGEQWTNFVFELGEELLLDLNEKLSLFIKALKACLHFRTNYRLKVEHV